MTLIVTSQYELNRVVAPRLPTAPPDYEKRYHDQFADVLRLYFNRLDNILGQLVATMETIPVTIGDQPRCLWASAGQQPPDFV